MPLPARDDFDSFEGRVWLNCAHQGPLPKVAARAAQRAICDKLAPHRIRDEDFRRVPLRLKELVGRLINRPSEEIILANSASYGLHMLANGIPLESGDEVLLMKGDFPSDILPWLALRERGVTVRLIEPRNHVLSPQEVEANLTPATRVLCTTWVHSFSGFGLDVETIGTLCRRNSTWFVVNASQAAGARPIDLAAAPVDALVSVGFKWLCGPYGTGFAWVRDALLDVLEYNQAYWLSMRDDDDLSTEAHVAPSSAIGAAKYDVFGTANFFNFEAWAAALELLLDHGIDRIAAHDQALVTRLIDGIDPRQYRLLSPQESGPARSTLVFVTHRDNARNHEVYATVREAGVDVALREGKIRLSPHLYNTAAEIDRALEALRAAGV